MATATPYGAAMDPYDPQAAVRARVRANLQQPGADPTVPAGDGTTAATATTPSPDFYDRTPSTLPGGTGQPIYTAQGSTQTGAPDAPPVAPPNEPAPGNDSNQIAGWFSNFLGRSATADDMNFWLNQAKVNAGGLDWVRTQIANSPEAQAYANRPGGQFNPTQTAAPAAQATPGTAAVTAPPTSGFTDQLRALLMQRLQSASAPVDPNSPEIAASVNAARDEGTRSADAERTALAERLYAQGGLNTNALTQQIQQSSEKNAANVGNLRANLLMNAYNQKRQELESDLQLAFASGDAESARAIQIQIANLQATVQREGIGANLAINASNQNANTVGAGA